MFCYHESSAARGTATTFLNATIHVLYLTTTCKLSSLDTSAKCKIVLSRSFLSTCRIIPSGNSKVGKVACFLYGHECFEFARSCNYWKAASLVCNTLDGITILFDHERNIAGLRTTAFRDARREFLHKTMISEVACSYSSAESNSFENSTKKGTEWLILNLRHP